jgi:hypothetical protein
MRRTVRYQDGMHAMAFIWALIIVGGLTYFSIIGLSHH